MEEELRRRERRDGELLMGVLDEDVVVVLIICAFCFSTSAGVRIRQETSSPMDDAVAFIRG